MRRSFSRQSGALILSPKWIDARATNDFPSVNIQLKQMYFANCQVFYYYLPLITKGIRHVRNEILERIKAGNIEVVFFEPNGSNYELPIEFFSALRKATNVKLVLWVLDDELIFDVHTKYYAQVFDAVVTCDYYATYGYRKLGVPALYHFSSYCKEDLHPVETARDIDVSFVGDCTKSDRAFYLGLLARHGMNVQAFGNGSTNGFVDKYELSMIFSRTKVNLNFTKVNEYSVDAWFIEDNPIVNVVRQNKGRPMEIAMTRSFCLSEYSSSLSEVFEPGREIDVFHDSADMLEKIRFYLRHDAIREEMARKAYLKASNTYEARVRVPHLLDELCAILTHHRNVQRAAVIYKNSTFKRNHINHLTFVMWYQALTGRLGPAWETFTCLFQYGIWVFGASFLKGSKRAVLKFAQRVRERSGFGRGHVLGRSKTRSPKSVLPLKSWRASGAGKNGAEDVHDSVVSARDH